MTIAPSHQQRYHSLYTIFTMFEITAFHSLVFLVGNAKMMATYFFTKFGFHHYAYRGLETDSRDFAEHAVKSGNIIFIFRQPLMDAPVANDHVSEINVIYRGDDDDQPPYSMSNRVRINFIHESEAASYISEEFDWKMLPKAFSQKDDPLNTKLLPTFIESIDHVVSNYGEGDMEKICDLLEGCLNMHRFWSVDENVIHTEYSSLRSIVMASPNEKVLLPINEPAKGKKKSQIQEYIDFNMNEPGVQHIALRTTDVITTVHTMKTRGVNFLHVPKEYYVDLRKRLAASKCVIKEPLDDIERLGILVDFDDNGYLLQIFTEAIDYRPTIFFEIIQRNNHSGFGAGNFKALFSALEIEQQKRGNLTDV